MCVVLLFTFWGKRAVPAWRVLLLFPYPPNGPFSPVDGVNRSEVKVSTVARR